MSPIFAYAPVHPAIKQAPSNSQNLPTGFKNISQPRVHPILTDAVGDHSLTQEICLRRSFHFRKDTMQHPSKPLRLRSTISALGLLIGMGATASAHSEQVTHYFTGVVTALSNSTQFGGASLNTEITGMLSYDTATTPDKNWGNWAATYTLQGDNTTLTLNLPNNTQYEDSTLDVRLVNGPAYPYASDDTFSINPNNWLTPSDYVSGGITQRLNLNFQNVTGIHGLDSALLPASIDLSKLPFSGGMIQVITGPTSTSDDVYIVNRGLIAYNSSPYSSINNSISIHRFSNGTNGGSQATFSLEPIPGAPTGYINPEIERYNTWLATGNTPLYLDVLTFQLTSIATATAVPEANALLMFFGGIAAMGLARRRMR